MAPKPVEHFDQHGHEVFGIDNNMRRLFFGAPGDTLGNLERLKGVTRRFSHFDVDVRVRISLEEIFRANRFDLIIHCAAQSSQDRARDIPLVDFESLGTINLLEGMRLHRLGAAFVFISTNKIYGDAPNVVPMTDLETRPLTTSYDNLHAVVGDSRYTK